MAFGATWQRHVDARERLRGAEATRGRIFIFTIYIVYIIYIGLPIIGRNFINRLISHTLYMRDFPSISSMWD